MTPQKTYKPQAGSLASQVIGFFQNNRDEHLTLDDITEKFACTRGNVHTLLRLACDAGQLVRARDEDGDYIYKRGPLMAAVCGVDIDHVRQQRAKLGRPSGFTSARKIIDIDALQVDDDVPFMPLESRGTSKWDPLFAKLCKVGQSVAIPADCKSALSAAVLGRNKKKLGTFKVALTEPGQARVWRTA